MPDAQKSIAYIKWCDASYQRGECTAEDLVPEVIIESAGFLIREDEKTYSIAMDWYESYKTWRYIEHIPKVNVIRFELIEINKDMDRQNLPDIPSGPPLIRDLLVRIRLQDMNPWIGTKPH